MPQAINNQNSSITLLHELNKSQLNVGELQILGLCAKCSAVGKLLTQELAQHRLNIKANKANKLCKEINEISTAINKNLVQQLPLIKKLMERSLKLMTLPEGASMTNAQMAQEQTYIKTVNLLQENIVQINKQLENATQRVFEAVPKARQNELQTLFKSLAIYQSTLCGANLMSTEFSRLTVFLGCLKSNVELYIGGVSDGPEKIKLQQFASTIDQLDVKNKVLWETFTEQETNNLSIMKIFDSAKQKYSNLTKQLKEGDFSNPDILLAIAQRHETDAIVEYGLEQMKLIHDDYDSLAEDVLSSLQKFQLDDVNSLAEELIQSKPVTVEASPAVISKPQKTTPPPPKEEVKQAASKKPANTSDQDVLQKSMSRNFYVQLAKLADWLKHDTQVLNSSKSHEKRELGQVIGEQLDEIYSQLDISKWPSDALAGLERKTDIEQRLSALGQLIAETMAQNSPTSSPTITPKTSPPDSQASKPSAKKEASLQTSPTETLPRQNLLPVVEQKQTATLANKKPIAKTTTIKTEVVKPEIINASPAAGIAQFDNQLQTAIQKMNSARTIMFEAYTRQENFRQKLVENNQPFSMAWANINHTDMVLDYISQHIAYGEHSLYIKPYMEYKLPMAEMVRSIQAERFHPHFDQLNCQTYLGRTLNWLDTFTPHFEYLDQLMSVTESMLSKQQQAA